MSDTTPSERSRELVEKGIDTLFESLRTGNPLPPDAAEGRLRAHLARLEKQVERARGHLKWAMLEIMNDRPSEDQNGTPAHHCQFKYNPAIGACRWHERFWGAWLFAGLEIPEPTALQDMEEQSDE